MKTRVRALLLRDDTRVVELLRNAPDYAFELDTCEGLDCVAKHLEDGVFDIVLLRLPRPAAALPTVLERAPHTPVVVLLENEDAAEAARALHAGAQDCLFLDRIDTAKLTRTIRAAIDRNMKEEVLRERSRRIRDLAASGDARQRQQIEEALHASACQHQVVADLGRRALAGADLGVLMNIATLEVAHMLGVECCKVLELVPPGDRLHLVAGVGWKEGYVGDAYVDAGIDSQAGYTLVTDGAVLVDDFETEARFVSPPILIEHGIVSGMSVVIRGSRAPFGVLGAHTATRRSFGPDDAYFLEAVANVLADAIERRHFESELVQSREQLRELAKRLQDIREEERTAVAREIHDDLGQALTGLKMDVSWLTERVHGRTEHERAASMLPLIDSTLDTVRQLSARLRPAVLDDLGLVAAMEWQAREFERRYGIECACTYEAEPASLTPDQATTIFRIFQEALTNVARHAGATRVDVRLHNDRGVLALEVRDDGRGMGERDSSEATSLGLLGMHERAAAVGASFQVRTRLRARGTLAELRLPLAEDRI